MAIQFQCPSCDAVVKVPDSAAGKVGRCPKCDKRLQIPDVAPPPAGAAPQVPPLPDFESSPMGGPLLGDKSTVFVLPPAQPPIGPPVIGPPPEPVAAPAAIAPVPANPAEAREEFDIGKQWLSKPFVPGAGWPPALRAVIHFTKAARLDPKNADYATHAGSACQLSIDRFLESWGTGSITSIAAFHAEQPLGQQIDKAEKIFRPSGLSAENLELIRSQAHDALQWYAQALAIDPEDTTTRCRRAELLMNVGAFPQALEDAKTVLSSPLVPSKAREAAQRVADFILEDDSPLRKYLTRAQAQQSPPPTGVELPKPSAPANRAPAPPPPTTTEIPFAINIAGGTPAFPNPTALAPTAAELPMFVSPTTVGTTPPSVASRLKKRPGGGWVGVAVPILFGLLLVGAGLGYMHFSRVKFVAPLTGEDLGNTTLRRTFFGNEFGLPHDKVELLTSTFRDEPETIRSQLRTMTLRGSAQGLEISIRPGEQSRMVRVDVRSDPRLHTFCQEKEHAAALEGPLARLRTATLHQFGRDFVASSSGGLKMGNLGEYLDTLGGDLLVGGLGYHVVAQTPERVYPCVFEDEAGMLYFLLPAAVTTFQVVPRTFLDPPEEETVFGTKLQYDVTVAPAAAPPLSAPAASPAAAAVPPPATRRPSTTASAGEPAEALPSGFFGDRE